MDIEQQEMPERPKKTWSWVLIALAIIIASGLALYYFVLNKPAEKKKTIQSAGTGETVFISQKVLDNKFGFLGGGSEDDGSLIAENGAAWVRPHPGYFVWDMMQKDAGAAIDFEDTDDLVENMQGTELGMLATIWPFADWDQQKSINAANCKVSSNDEFLHKNDKKGRGAYLPEYRCKPVDWTAYQNWVMQIIERYDGDGVDDMPGLKIPVKYWEVMNEPDLTSPPQDSGRLDFWKGNAADYAELLVKTSANIRIADSSAKVLIAGAAGGDEQFLNFYREVLKNKETLTAFDIGNVHCISNDREKNDFNVGAYKYMLAEFNISKPVWVTEAEAMYGSSGEENYQSTKTSTAGAIAAGAERIFFTRYGFDDTRTDMSQKNASGTYPSSQKYLELIESFSK